MWLQWHLQQKQQTAKGPWLQIMWLGSRRYGSTRKRKENESGMKRPRDYLLAGGFGLLATIRRRPGSFCTFSRLGRVGVGGKDMVAYSGQL